MNFNLRFGFPPGDCWCLTSIVRDFAEQFPGDSLSVDVPCPAIFEGNPFYTPYIHKPGQEIFFRFATGSGNQFYGNFRKTDTMVGAIYDYMRKHTGRNVQQKCTAPEIYLTEDEKRYSLIPPEKPVCVLNAGWKADIPAKYWGMEKYESVVEALRDKVTFVQVGANRRGMDFHKHIPGAVDMIGKTTLRELAQLVYHADFVLTGISQLHHLSGIQCYKPRHCITVAGAREPENWANCHSREGVTWHWITSRNEFKRCVPKKPGFHDQATCWESDCSDGRSPACMEAIQPERIIKIFKELL